MMKPPRMHGYTPLRLAYELVTRISAGRLGQQANSRSRLPEKAQSTMENQKVAVEELSEQARQEVKDNANFIQEASYQELETEGYSLCVEVESLVERFPNVLALFSDEVYTLSAYSISQNSWRSQADLCCII
jgi:hypothetical protein